MKDNFAKNIQILRKMFGLTQKQVGVDLSFAHNTVSKYESSSKKGTKKGIDYETLSKFADYFSLPIEEIMNKNISFLGELEMDSDALLSSISTIFPIVETEEAMCNEHFKHAHEIHKSFFDDISNIKYAEIFSIIVDEYCSAISDFHLEDVIIANLLSLYCFNKSLCVISLYAQESNSILIKKSLNNKKINFEKNEIKKMQEKINNFNSDEAINDVYNWIEILKKSEKWNELGDYYIALRYVCGLEENGYSFLTNNSIGRELMFTYALIGNPYAGSFIALFYPLSGKVFKMKKE